MLNSISLVGRLVADPELRSTATNISVTSFRVAVDRDFTPAGEERKADFFDIVAWRKTAEFVTRFFHKGSLIAIQGSLQTRSFVDKEGNKRTAYEIVAANVSFCGGKSDNSTGDYSSDSVPGSAPAPSYSTATAGDFESLPTDDELPF